MSSTRHIVDIAPDAIVMDPMELLDTHISPKGYPDNRVRTGDVRWPERTLVLVQPDDKPEPRSVANIHAYISRFGEHHQGAGEVLAVPCSSHTIWRRELRQVPGQICLRPTTPEEPESVFNDSWPSANLEAIGFDAEIYTCWSVTLNVRVDIQQRLLCSGAVITYFMYGSTQYNTTTPDREPDWIAWSPCSHKSGCGDLPDPPDFPV